ncbi:MAG: Holliday junction resolvase-like protein [Nanoarchaeota archaeon]
MAYEVLILVVLLILVFLLYFNLRKKYNELEEDYEDLQFDIKSMHVKHGKTWEAFVPFMENYPGEKGNSVFLGNPVDFISFDDDFVKFIEVKTGKSQLNEKQKRVKDLIENRKVKWYELRYEK